MSQEIRPDFEPGDVPAALADWEEGLRPEVGRRQALARKGMAQFAPPSRAHVWVRDLVMRAVLLPGVRGLVVRSIRRANRGPEPPGARDDSGRRAGRAAT